MFNFLLRIRARLQRLFHLSEAHTMLLWACVAGFVGALATVLFRSGIDLVQWLIVRHAGSLVEIAHALPWPVRIAMPALGGVVAGGFLVIAARAPGDRTASDYMEAITIGEGQIPVRQSLLRSLSSLCTIATGGSIGREGSMVHLAALGASVIGRFRRFDPPRLRLLVACGAAAGITSAYNAPIAGAFFVTEIVLGSIAMENFGPIVVASVVANTTMRTLPGYHSAYVMPEFPVILGAESLLFVVLGMLAGVLSPLFLRGLDASKSVFRKTGWPLPVRLGLGGLGVGVLSVYAPEVWGNGYSVVNSILHSPWTWTALATVLIFKVVATSLTVGSGAIGGVFTPTLFVGATIGSLFGLGANALWPHATSAPFAYAIVGMGAFLAAATSAPLMAILMIFEMTLSYQVVLPLMLACVVAYFIARTQGETSMYEVIIARNRSEQERVRLRATQMRELIRPADTVIADTAAFSEITRVFLEYPVKYVYVVDPSGLFRGVVALQDVTSALLRHENTDAMRAADLLREKFDYLTPDMSLGEGFQHFLMHQGERLPVIESHATPTLLGVVYKTSLLDAYGRMGNARV
ncbi:ClcB-like voltage-gated chloride channel protein [Pararobbsia silviterrae]|uniref:Voltage-gated chloride channel ClcB n=1 Tax=Pararobbsia silviterrae TaxID=1792498 RepID=A0A494Y1U8_9BURK|nr:ClcB-like voltage-gated chloride channel protein [Pararobbsia silviterrae]RKP56735.1 voltage-gated chloride channel ClcB [Pararobbsia silviterrae]